MHEGPPDTMGTTQHLEEMEEGDHSMPDSGD